MKKIFLVLTLNLFVLFSVQAESWGDKVFAPNGKECPVPQKIKKFGVISRCVNGHLVSIASYGVDNNCKLDWIEYRDHGTPLKCALE